MDVSADMRVLAYWPFPHEFALTEQDGESHRRVLGGCNTMEQARKFASDGRAVRVFQKTARGWKLVAG